VAKALGDIAAVPIDIQRQRREQQVLTQFGDTLDSSELAELSSGSFMAEMGLNQKSDQCTRNEFILAMLLRLGKVSAASPTLHRLISSTPPSASFAPSLTPHAR
jgi:hypothetical protein